MCWGCYSICLANFHQILIGQSSNGKYSIKQTIGGLRSRRPHCNYTTQNKAKAKADMLSMGNVKGFWLLEFLKIVGLYHAGITRTLRGVKDRKSYVIAPINIDFEDSESVVSEFKKSMQIARPAITSDIIAVISYVRAMLYYANERESLFLQLFKQRPRNV